MVDYKDLLNVIAEPFVVFDAQTGEMVYANQNAISLFGLSGLQDETVRLRYFCSRPDLFNEKMALKKFTDLAQNETIKLDWPVRLGEVRWLSAMLRKLLMTDRALVAVSFRDNTLHYENSMQLNALVQYREMLSQLLSDNTIVPSEGIPKLIDQSLSRVGQFFHCDRVYVFEFAPDMQSYSNINEWCAQGVEAYIDQLQNVSIKRFPYLADYLLNKQVFCIVNVDDLPNEASSERAEFAKEGIQSLLLIPFSEGDELIGFFGLDHVHTVKYWSQLEISNLQLLANAFANMLLRWHKEKRITEQEAMYKAWFMSANDSIVIFKNGYCIDANPKALSDFGCERNYMIGKNLIELSATQQNEGKSPAYINVYQAEVMKGVSQSFEWVFRRKNGQDFDVEINLNRFNEKGDVHIIAIFKDITEQNRAVKNIIREEAGLSVRSVIEKDISIASVNLLELFDTSQLQKMQDAFSYATGISSVITDVSGQPITEISFSNAICKLVRSTEEGVKMCMESSKELGEMAHSAKMPVSRPCSSCGFIDAASPIIVDGQHIGNWVIGQVRHNDLDVKKLLAYTKSLGINDEKVLDEYANLVEIAPDHFDKILNLLNVLTNELSSLGYNNLKLGKTIENHMLLERKLVKAKQKAEESDRLKSAFLANLSHEIRTPMNGIVGFAELLQYDGLTPDDRREYIRLIHQSSSQLLNIINDIIDISKIESGQIEVRANYYDLNSLMRGLKEFFADKAAEKGIGIACIADGSDELEMYSDDVKMRQVLTNLISNAIKFTAVGAVEFGYILRGDAVEVFVKDSGTGIDSDSLELIFDRFWQAKDVDVKKGGTGLGLAITKAYVELLGGHIQVASELGVGTRFSFTVPIVLR